MNGEPTLQTEWAAPFFAVQGAAGEGGSAIVHDARTEAGARVALKVARTSELAHHFAREASIAIRLEHAGLPRVLWCGWVRPIPGGFEATARDSCEARAALALAWIEGLPAAEVPSNELQALTVVADVASTLAAMHAAGWAHGDVSLANVLVDVNGRGHLLDAGLAVPVGTRDPRGATLRYLAPLAHGDARARDLAALGGVVAELAEPTLRFRTKLLEDARRWAESSPGPLAGLAAPLLCASPWSRPEAGWVAERAASERGLSPHRGAASATLARVTPAGWRAGEVRSAYLRVRLEGDAAGEPGDAQPEWLADVVTRLAQARLLEGQPAQESRPMAALDPLGMSQWIVALCGASAAEWPVDRLAAAGERRVEAAMIALAAASPPHAWTLDALERGVDGAGPPPVPRVWSPSALERTAELALALAATPVEASALFAVEGDVNAPEALVLAAADALRRAGETARAGALVRRAVSPRGAALAADIHRRAGDPARARDAAAG